jgi:TrmH family RNA methyltransferase
MPVAARRLRDIVITSPSNPRVKRLVRLRRRRDREEEGVTIVEGVDEVRRAIGAGATVREAYRREGHALEGLDPGVDVVELSAEAFDKAAVRGPAAGLLAVVDDPTRTLHGLEIGDDPLLLVVEGGEKPGNLGAMLRTADAVGVDAVIVADPTTDVANPNVVRASLGCVFTVPVARASSHEAIAWLRGHGVAIAATLVDGAVDLWDARLTGGVAVVIGTEHDGLSDVWPEAADVAVRIPMSGVADSLNASVSAAVLLYEAARQRSTA